MRKRLWIIIPVALAAVALAIVGFVTFTSSSASTAYKPRHATVSSSAPATTTPPATMDTTPPPPPPPAPPAPTPVMAPSPMPAPPQMSAPRPPFANDGDLDNRGGPNDADGNK
jgi:hypothetical protein